MTQSRARRSNNPDVLTTPQAAEYLGVSRQTLWEMGNRGELTPLVPEGNYVKPPVRYYRREELDVVRQRRMAPQRLVPYVQPRRRAALAAQQAAQQAARPNGSVA